MQVEVIPVAVATSAAVLDLRWRRIPNWLTLTAFLGGLVLQATRYGLPGVGLGLAGAALGFGLLMPFYLMRAMGGGDVKLLAAVGALVGPQALVTVAIAAALAGGVISSIMLAQRGVLQVSLAEIVTQPHRLSRSGARAPYAVAIAFGVYVSTLLASVTF